MEDRPVADMQYSYTRNHQQPSVSSKSTFSFWPLQKGLEKSLIPCLEKLSRTSHGSRSHSVAVALRQAEEV